MPRKPHQPKYRLHKASGQAVVTFDGRDTYLGKHGSAESLAEYDRLIALWLANGRQIPTTATELTVTQILDAYYQHAQTYYRQPDPDTGELVPTSQVQRIVYALQPVRQLFGTTAASGFGPLALKAVRRAMIEKGWCRTYINCQIDCVKRAFKWAVSEEMVPASVYQGLRAVQCLAEGRSDAEESEPVTPAPEADVEAVKGRVSRHIRDLIDLQLLTGMRPGEALRLRPRDVDRSGKVWLYRPEMHKGRFRKKTRTIYLGPRAQAILARYLLRDADAYCFCPKDAAEEYARERGWPVDHIPDLYKNPRYPSGSYSDVVRAACKRAGVEPWHPHQLRHLACTRLVEQFGWDIARIVLGHSTLCATRIYGEDDTKKAAEAILQVG